MNACAAYFRLCVAVCLAGGLLHPGFASGEDLAAEDKQAIESAREALADGDNPWYDSQTDSLKEMDLQRRERPSWGTDWAGLLSMLGGFLEVLVYTLLALALAAIVGLLVWFALNLKRGPKSAKKTQDDAIEVLDQVEALPFMAERSRDDLLGQARRHYEQGNYNEAIIYLFSYELVELDKFSRIHLSKGKTNRQYLRELASAAPLRTPLERTLLAFESVFFGRRPLDRGGFEACWNELPQFEAQLRGAT